MNIDQSLTRCLLENVTETVFWRGVDYAHQDKVGRINETEKRLTAAVAGTKLYEVEFHQGPKYIKGYCSCPFATTNADYCKHVIAVAVFRDEKLNLPLPLEDEVSKETMEVTSGFGRQVETMFRKPMEADLELLAHLTDYGKWVRPHAKIAVVSTIESAVKPLTDKEVRRGLDRISTFMNRSSFDPYFCAGEITAVISKTYDAITKRFETTETTMLLNIVKSCFIYYYNEYLQGIDGSDGVWQIAQARLKVMIAKLKEKGMTNLQIDGIFADLNKRISGWGDIRSDLDSD